MHKKFLNFFEKREIGSYLLGALVLFLLFNCILIGLFWLIKFIVWQRGLLVDEGWMPVFIRVNGFLLFGTCMAILGEIVKKE